MESAKIKCIQIFYANYQKSHLLDQFIPYDNSKTTTKFAESGVIDFVLNDYISNNIDFDYLGFFSWKARDKMGNHLSMEYVKNLVANHKSVDIFAHKQIFFNEFHCLRDIHAGSSLWNTLDNVLWDIGYNSRSEISLTNEMRPIYCNHFVAKRKVWLDFYKNLFSPFLNLLKTNRRYIALSSKSVDDYQCPVPWNFQKFTGFNYWPIAPFLMERLINVYIEKNKKSLKLKYLL